MTSGVITSTGAYKVGGGFNFVVADGSTGLKHGYTAEIGSGTVFYCGDSIQYTPATQTTAAVYELKFDTEKSAGSIVTRTSGDYYSAWTGSTNLVPAGTISEVTFMTLTYAASGAGSLSHTSGTIYGNKYAVSGDSHTFSATPSSGYKLKKIEATSGGSVVATTEGTAATTLTLTITGDTQVIAYFIPSSYTLTKVAHVGSGSVRVFRTPSGSSTETEIMTGSVTTYTVYAGDSIRILAAPSLGWNFSYLRVNNTRYSSTTSESTQSISFLIEDNSVDTVYDFQVYFVQRSVFVNTLVVDSATYGSVAITDEQGATVPVSSNNWSAYYGCQYTLAATAGTNCNFLGYYENDALISLESSLKVTQGSSARNITAKFAQKQTVTVTTSVGDDAVHYGSSSTAATAGCTCTASGSSYGGNWTFTPTPATGWQFDSLYVQDDSGTGETKKYTMASGESSIAVDVNYNATVIAIFSLVGSSRTPADQDQGGTSTTVSTGVWKWEGANTRMVADWKSRRNVYMKPLSFSCARVYADGYSQTYPVLKIHQYQSPNTSDSVPIVLNLCSQDAVRVPVQRPEKYVELEVVSDKHVLEIAAATSMGSLWQVQQ